jgi:hypothetical protein
MSSRSNIFQLRSIDLIPVFLILRLLVMGLVFTTYDGKGNVGGLVL